MKSINDPRFPLFYIFFCFQGQPSYSAAGVTKCKCRVAAVNFLYVLHQCAIVISFWYLGASRSPNSALGGVIGRM